MVAQSKPGENENLNNVGGHLSRRAFAEVSRLAVKVSELASCFILMATPMKVANTIVARRLLHPLRRAHGGGRKRV